MKVWLAGAATAALAGLALFMALRPGPAPEADPAPAVIETNRIALTPEESRAATAAGALPPDVKSLLKIERKLNYGEFVWDDEGAPEGPMLVRVNLETQMLQVFRAGHEIGTSVILYGADSHATPQGEFPIKAKLRDYHSRTYDAPMPFTLWLTDDGVAIHGSSVRFGRATHGCVGVPNDFAALLFDAAKVGDRVQILAS